MVSRLVNTENVRLDFKHFLCVLKYLCFNTYSSFYQVHLSVVQIINTWPLDPALEFKDRRALGEFLSCWVSVNGRSRWQRRRFVWTETDKDKIDKAVLSRGTFLKTPTGFPLFPSFWTCQVSSLTPSMDILSHTLKGITRREHLLFFYHFNSFLLSRAEKRNSAKKKTIMVAILFDIYFHVLVVYFKANIVD